MAETENPQTIPPTITVNGDPLDLVESPEDYLDRDDVQAALSRAAGDHKSPAPSAHEYLGRVFALLGENDAAAVGEKVEALRDQFLTELAASEGVVAP